MHEKRKSKYNLRRNQPREHYPQSMSYDNITPIKTLPLKGKKLNHVLSRLTRQTESSGRKNRNTKDELFTKPSNTYTNAYTNTYTKNSSRPFSAAKKMIKQT